MALLVPPACREPMVPNHPCCCPQLVRWPCTHTDTHRHTQHTGTHRHTQHPGTTQSRIVQHWHGTARTSSVFRHRARVPPGCHKGASHRNPPQHWLTRADSGFWHDSHIGRRKGYIYDTQNSLSRKPYAKSRPFQSCFCLIWKPLRKEYLSKNFDSRNFLFKIQNPNQPED